MKIASQPLTFLDTTDSRKLEVYISSNHPTIQLYDVNDKKYTPDWSTTNLKLSADVFLDSTETKPEKMKWYRQYINETTEALVSSGDYTEEITVNSNMAQAVVTYICRAEYQGIRAFSKITFTRTDTGLNGTDGKDGTSVTIDGTAYYNETLSDDMVGQLISLYTDDEFTTPLDTSSMVEGDSYVVQGYLCVYSPANDKFICVGRIQGPKGDKGEDAKAIILTGSAQVFKVSKANVYTPSTISVTATPINTTITDWTYSVNGGQTFLNAVPTGVARNGNTVTITGSTFTSNSLVIKASDGQYSDVFTIYKAFDGVDGSDGEQGDPAPFAFLTNENISFAANSSGQVALTSFTTNVVAYIGTTKTTPVIGTITDLPTGMTVSSPVTTANEQILTFSIANNSTLGSATSNSGTITIPVISPVSTNLKLSWSKINTGAMGAGIESTTVSYGVSDSSSTQPTEWQSTIPTVADGKYLWTRTIIDYTDEKIPDTVTYIYAKQGTKGDSGTAGSSVTVSSVQYQEGASATTAPTGTWSNAVVAVADGKYLWTKTAFSDGKTAYGVAKQGANGKDGVGISSITVDYGVSDNASTKPTTWQQSIPVVAEGKYLWTRTITDYTDASVADTVAYVYAKQGIKGETGVAGSSVTVSSIQYQAGTSATTAPTGTWSDSVVAVSEGNYLWTKTAFSDGKIAYGVAKQGQKGDKGDKGDQGVQGPKGNDGQQLYTWIKYADTPTSGMSNDPAGKTYIGLAYNKTTATESSTYSDYMWSLIKGATGPTGPKGDDGQQYYTWIKYADNASGANMSDSPTGKLYIGLAYNKTTSTESSVASDYTWALFKGDKGDKGDDAYTVLLTNESHVFAGSISAAIASSATTQVLAYNGATSQSVTIVSVNGVAASTAATATGIAGLSFKCSALSGTTPTITFTCTTAFVSPNGTIPIVIKVGNISITKMFTYSIAFKGATGGVGAPSSSYWLVANADAVQKTTSGDILCTPATVTFTGKIQTGTSAPTDYAGRWIIAYTTDGTTYTDLYTSTANEASTSVAAGITYKALRARMYLAGGTTTLLDEQIIPFVSDGAIGVPGNDAVTFQVYSSNGYALSTNTPTVTLQTFAYIGDVAITSGAIYQWYSYNNGWSAISGATLSYLDVSRTDVSFSKSYMCKMIFGGVEYTGVATIDDKNDTNKVFTSKPSNYTLGDLWIVGMDYIPNGVEVGTLLRTEHTNATYADSDWIAATKYDEKINALNSSVDKYDKYFSFDSQNGLKISARDANGNASQFSTTLSNERLSFNQGTDAVAYIESNKMKIKEAEIISPLTVTGQYSGSTMLQAPIINIGNFSIVVESNGSLSIIANT